MALVLEMILGHEKIFILFEPLDKMGIAGQDDSPFLSRPGDQPIVRDLPLVQDVEARHPKPSGELA